MANDDGYMSDLDVFRLGWEHGFIAGEQCDGLAPSADEMFFRLFPNGEAVRETAPEPPDHNGLPV